MPVSLEDFCHQISALGLLSESELSTARSTVNSIPLNEATRELVKNLVRQKKVTVYQAQQLYNGNGSTLTMGNYLILDKIGQGGMGMVFKALHRRMDRLVAVKVLPPTMVKTASSIQRFQREVRAVAKLDHPNIVAAYDADESGGTHFLVMQFVDGKDFSAKVRDEGRLPIASAIDYIHQAAKGLAYAHGQSIIHRDIKPANLLLGSDGVIRVLDLGLARIQNDGANLNDQLTQSGHIMGTVDYMAPEQALDTRTADERADIYSLGATFWYLVTAESLYPGDSIVQKLVAHQNASLRVLSDLRPDATNEIEVWLSRMLAKLPEDRFQSMEEVILSLEELAISSASKQDGHRSTSGTAMMSQSLVDNADQSIGSFQIKTSNEIRTNPKSRKSVARAKPLANFPPQRYRWPAAALLPVLVVTAIVVFIRNDDGIDNRIDVSEGANVEIVQTQRSIPSKSPAPTLVESVPASIAPMSQSEIESLASTSQKIEKATSDSSWEYLFNGTGASGWSTLGSFRIQDNLLVADGGRENAISRQEYSDFELEAVWKIGPGANSGIFYRNDPDRAVAAGNEYQIADHKSNPVIYPPEKQTGSLYGLIAPTEDVMHPPGEWSTTRIVCRGTKIEHWLNQRKVLEYDTSSDAFRTLKKVSDFSGNNFFGNDLKNFVLLQSVNGTIAFQSIRIRQLSMREIDLLVELDLPKQHSEDVHWRYADEVLTGEGVATSSKAGWCMLEFSRPIRGDYNVELSLKTDGIYPLQVDFPLGQEQAIRVHLSPAGSGLIVIDGIDIGLNRDEISPFMNYDAKLQPRQWQLLRGQIRQQGENLNIAVTLDGVSVGRFSGARSRISFPPWVTPDPEHVMLQARGDLSKVKLELRRAAFVSVIPE